MKRWQILVRRGALAGNILSLLVGGAYFFMGFDEPNSDINQTTAAVWGVFVSSFFGALYGGMSGSPSEKLTIGLIVGLIALFPICFGMMLVFV